MISPIYVVFEASWNSAKELLLELATKSLKIEIDLFAISNKEI
jgi:hypothetical protein